jgi:hypothetical protein
MPGRRWQRAAISLALVTVVLTVAGVGVAVSSEGHPARGLPPNPPRYAVTIQAVFDRAGNPLLVADFAPDGSPAVPQWAICPPGGIACRSAESHRRELAPGPEPAGTRFVASAAYGGHTYTASVAWKGPVRALTPPSLTGSRRVGGVVNPVGGRWSGGWGSETDQLGVEACRTLRGHHCRMLGGGEYGCPDRTSRTRLTRRFVSWYLFALDARMPKDALCAGTGYSSNVDLPLWKLGPTVVRSRALGRIAAPHGARFG